MDMVERVTRAIEICPVCDGEGHIADGLDDAAVSMDCPKCFGTGYDAKAAIRAMLEGLEPVAWRYFIKPQEAGMGKTLLRTSRDPHLVDDGWTETPLYDLSALKEVV